MKTQAGISFKDIDGIKYFVKDKNNSSESAVYEYLGTRLAQIVSPDLVPEEIMCFLPGKVGTFDESGSFKGLGEVHTLYVQFVDGTVLDTKNCRPLFYQIGRQQALHKFLRLSDVKPEHFIVNDGTLKRIDLDSAFSETAFLANIEKFIPVKSEAAETAQAMATDKFSLKNELNDRYENGIDEDYVKGVKHEAKNIARNFVSNKEKIFGLLERALEIGDIELKNTLHDIRASTISQLVVDLTQYWGIIGILK